MIEIDIPSIDPIQHEPKIFIGMTSRQCVCIVPGVALGTIAFMLTKNISIELAMALTMTAVAPSVLLGWVKPYNMRFENYVKLLWYNNFVANPKRIYKTDAAEEVKLMTIKEREELEKKQRSAELEKKKKNKNRKEKQ